MMSETRQIVMASRESGTRILVVALVVGAVTGVAAKLMGTPPGPFQLLGHGLAFWFTLGYLIARRASGRGDVIDDAVWAGTTMAVFLGSWLLAYCFVYGLQDTSGFGAAWLNERVFFIISPVVCACVGVVAALSIREGRVGSAFHAGPLAWSIPEVVIAATLGWQYVLAAGVPTLAVACVAVAGRTGAKVDKFAFAAATVAGAFVAYGIMRLVGYPW